MVLLTIPESSCGQGGGRFGGANYRYLRATCELEIEAYWFNQQPYPLPLVSYQWTVVVIGLHQANLPLPGTSCLLGVHPLVLLRAQAGQRFGIPVPSSVVGIPFFLQAVTGYHVRCPVNAPPECPGGPFDRDEMLTDLVFAAFFG
jgi:hypothetical protein